MHVLVGLMTYGISWLYANLVPLGLLVLAYRLDRSVRELIELLRQQDGQLPGHQSVRSARGRHARHR